MPSSRPTPTQHKERVLIVVRTYPTPSQKDIEVSCTAGITSDGKWIRLFPVPYRFMDPDKRFAKYQEIECLVHKASDHRPESYRLNTDSIKILGAPLPTAEGWKARGERLEELEAHCMCCVRDRRDRDHAPTLGFFIPGEITKLELEATTAAWNDAQLAKLRQNSLWQNAPSNELVKIPYNFKYHYRCPHDRCNGHEQSCTDWEMGAAFLSWTRKYSGDWEAKFRQRFEHEMMERNDTGFYVGTLSNHPASWQIVGLWYPRKTDARPERQLSLL